MACGVPVITTDAGAIGEVAFGSLDGRHPGATACIVGKEDAPALRDAILALRSDPARRERMTRNALALVREHHGIDGMLDRMEAVFRHAVRPIGTPISKGVP